jgi:hypothetical protein
LWWSTVHEHGFIVARRKVKAARAALVANEREATLDSCSLLLVPFFELDEMLMLDAPHWQCMRWRQEK